MKLFKNQKGFTLIELLVVIGILAVLLAITLIAINPARQFAQANNTKRRSDVNAILNAVNQYMADNKGDVPIGITEAALSISKAGADICLALIPTYIAALPTDPTLGVGNGTGAGAAVTDCALATYDTDYTIMQNATTKRLTVSAPGVELEDTISITR